MTLTEQVETMFKRIENENTGLRDLKVKLKTLEEQEQTYVDDIEAHENEVILLEKTSALLKQLIDERTASAYETIEETMNWCLARVPLKQRYRIRIDEHSTKAGRGIVLTLIDQDTNKERTLKTQTGTAIAQIVSFLLLVVIVSISGKSKVMVLDEHFSGLDDKESIRHFSEILYALSENDGFQFFIVEQNREIASHEGIQTIPLDILDYNNGLVIVSDEQNSGAELA